MATAVNADVAPVSLLCEGWRKASYGLLFVIDESGVRVDGASSKWRAPANAVSPLRARDGNRGVYITL